MTTLSIKPVLLLIVLALLSAFCNAQGMLRSNGRLLTGQSLNSGQYRLAMQNDCNLVLYDNNRLIWDTKTAWLGVGCSLMLRDTGDLVVYLTNNQPIWRSNTARGVADYRLVLQSDRNLVIYAPGGRPIWATNTQRAMNKNMANGTVSTNHVVKKHA